eukprot:COSAG05_NODE_217_length_13794_cov_5.734064_9_plen_66_part_00
MTDIDTCIERLRLIIPRAAQVNQSRTRGLKPLNRLLSTLLSNREAKGRIHQLSPAVINVERGKCS